MYAVLIGRFFGATDVGYFTQAHNLTNTLSTIISAVFQNVTYPVMTSVNDDLQRLVSIYEKLIQLTVVVTIPFFAGFAVVAKDFVNVFLGNDWEQIIPLLMILSFARLLTPLSVINLNILNAVGRSDLFLKVDLFKLPLTVAAMFVSIPFGIEGVAWAMLLTVVISFFINAYYPSKLFGFTIMRQLVFFVKPGLAAGVMMLVLGFVQFSTPVVTLVAKILTGIIVYISAITLLRINIMKDILLMLKN